VLPVHLCFPGTQVLNQLQLAQGAAVAQALALRCGYDPIVITHGNQVRPEAFNVMLGTMTELQAYLLPSEARQVNYSFLALRRLVGAQGYLLIVTGVDINAVSDGILALGFARQSLPESNTAAIREVIVPDNPPFIRREPLQAASSYTLLQLEETNNPISLGPDGGLIVDVFLPGYVSVVPDVNVEIRVHFAQRARAFAGGNAIVLKVNDREIARSKPSEVVASPLGGNEVLFSIPMQSFDPGRNLLHFTNAAAADQEGFRLGPDDLQIFADTTIMMPQVTDPVVLPDLRVTSRTFFPFIGQPDGSQITILLTDMSQNTINSAWTFMARMAQMANTFFYAADIGTEIIDPSRDVVVIGRYSGIPSGIQRLIQLSAFDYQSLSEEDLSLNETVRGVNLRIFLQDNWQRMKSGGVDQSMEDPESPAVPGSSSAQNFLYLTCIPPDQERTRWTLILTAFGGATLEERTAMLVQEDVWSRLRGTIARLGDKPGTLQTFVPSEAKFIDQTYDFVEMPLGQRIDLRFWFIASGISLLLLIILTVKLLSKIEAATVGQNRS